MKKLIVLFASVFCFVLISNAQTEATSINGCDSFTDIAEENDYSGQLMASVGSRTSSFEILVRATNDVDQLCNYYNGSWLDAGITLYCSFGGDVYTCTAHRVVKAVCAVNGAVKLMIEGEDIASAIKQALFATSTVYNLTKIDSRTYEISK